jgi:hypothetical protein
MGKARGLVGVRARTSRQPALGRGAHDVAARRRTGQQRVDVPVFKPEKLQNFE